MPKAFVPCSRSLLKPIERLMELMYMIRIFLIVIPGFYAKTMYSSYV
jgi:hypothetical protein